MPKDLFQHEDKTECRKIKSRGHYCHNFSRLGGTYCSCGRILPSTGRAVKLPGTLSLRCSTSSRLLSTGYQDPLRAEVVANPIHQDNIIKLTGRGQINVNLPIVVIDIAGVQNVEHLVKNKDSRNNMSRPNVTECVASYQHCREWETNIYFLEQQNSGGRDTVRTRDHPDFGKRPCGDAHVCKKIKTIETKSTTLGEHLRGRGFIGVEFIVSLDEWSSSNNCACF